MAPEPTSDPGPARRRRAPPALTRGWLRSCAEEHLRRFWPSVSQMRRVLHRRADRALAWHGGDRDAAAALVEQVLAELLAARLLDDARFARAWVDDLDRRGIPRRSMRQRLLSKGVDAALIDDALNARDQQVVEPELARACAYARRRRLGAARPEHRRPDDPALRRARRDKDVAALCRAGFSVGVALQVIDCPDLDALAARAGEET